MLDRSWMLNPKAIRVAKYCINVVKDELNIKLSLSHPEFMTMLKEYSELTDSALLRNGFQTLEQIANNEISAEDGLNALRDKETIAEKPVLEQQVVEDTLQTDELISVNGKDYPRWREGKEFRGMYRGQPSYR